MFVLEVEYLMGCAYAGSRDDRQTPEWPPHPARLFSALVAAYHGAGLGDDARQALLWLEQQPPPAISANDCLPRLESGDQGFGARRVPSSYVPHNYPRNQSGCEVLPWIRTTKGRKERQFPAVIAEGERVQFSWAAEPPGGLRTALQKIVDYVGYLGTSCSKARVAVCDARRDPDFEPCPDDGPGGELMLRVPHNGRLAVLESAYSANRQAPPGRPVYYRRVDSANVADAIQSEFTELLVLRRMDRAVLPARYAVLYTSILRDALLKVADEIGVGLSAIHGHDDTPHCAFLALPHTGHPHAESAIKAFAVAFPRGVNIKSRADVRQAARRISVLLLGHYGETTVTVLDDEPVSGTVDPANWVGPSRVWTSVTPVLLDRFPKGRAGCTVADIVAQSCARVELPTPISVEFGDYSPEAGVQPVAAFCLERKPGGQPRAARHVTIDFGQPVRGPVLLGAGRYFGLGLCKPLRYAEARS